MIGSWLDLFGLVVVLNWFVLVCIVMVWVVLFVGVVLLDVGDFVVMSVVVFDCNWVVGLVG